MMGTERVGDSNQSQSEYFRKARKAAVILRYVFHAQVCNGSCCSKFCVYTTNLLGHINACNANPCTFSGCSTTKRLMQHFDKCQSRSCLNEISGSESTPMCIDTTSASTSHDQPSQRRNYCLICTLATTSGGEYSLDPKISPGQMFGADISLTSPDAMSDAREAKSSTFSVHFMDDSNPALSRSNFWIGQGESKRSRRHSMDAIDTLKPAEDAECIDLITRSNTSDSEDTSALLRTVEASGNAPIVIVREANALRNYSVSWDS